MKVRKFSLEDAPDQFCRNLRECISWEMGANHGYEEACKDHQELVDSLAEAAECLEAQINGHGGFAVEEVLDSIRAVLAKYKGE